MLLVLLCSVCWFANCSALVLVRFKLLVRFIKFNTDAVRSPVRRGKLTTLCKAVESFFLFVISFFYYYFIQFILLFWNLFYTLINLIMRHSAHLKCGYDDDVVVVVVVVFFDSWCFVVVVKCVMRRLKEWILRNLKLFQF